MKLAVLFQATAVGTASIVGLRGYRVLILPLVGLVLGLAFFPAPQMDVDRVLRWRLDSWPMLTLGVLLPLALLAFSHVKEGRRVRDRRHVEGRVESGAGRADEEVYGRSRLPLG